MPNFRNDRVQELMRQEIDRIIRTDLDDPRLTGTYSVTRVDVSRDLHNAKVYVSVLEADLRKDVIKALKSAAGFIRRELGQRLSLRYIPELTIMDDPNIEYGMHIAKILKEVGVGNDDVHDQHEQDGEHDPTN
ncbi:MAG: 30S ribosome-binding factor RbfA [Clostridiales bacterium]|nr:30S ribosome-binding factor RbfA [Clostridiales bacterium]